MLGKLSLAAIPTDQPIVMAAVTGTLIIAAAVVLWVTWYGKWSYLWNEWLTSLDHKRIGVMYVVLALVMLLRGFSDAILMRSHQALAAGEEHGYLAPDHFNQIFSAHGTIMLLFMAMPFLVGLMNIALPLQLGARDVAFPFMNSLSFWLTWAAAFLVMVSLGVGEFSKAGWSGYAPLSELQYDPGSGVDYWLWAIQISGIATTMTGINFLVTILKLRAPGMTLMRMPIFAWTSLFTCLLIILAFPVLTVALALLALDRYLGMHFFTNTMGGNPMMYINMFWIWGHPEVYILILPSFGVYSEVVATFSSKRLFGYKSLVYATAAITVLSFGVWLHHFFTMGAGPDVNTAFSIATMLIAIPTGVKIFNWLFTMYRGRVRSDTPMLWTKAFLISFTIGGMAGVMLALPPADFELHDSLFLVAHFHTMLIPGSLFGFFAGLSYWFPKVAGFPLDERWGRRACYCWIAGFTLAFLPLYALGFLGMPRRMAHYGNPDWQPYLVIAEIGTGIIALGIAFQITQLIVSIRRRHANRDLSGDYWNGRTLEWATASPAPAYNFAITPTVHDIDAFQDLKERGTAYRKPSHYHAIHMPKNSGKGLIIGVLALVLGFSLVWYMWWIAIFGALGIVGTLIARSMEDDTEYVIPASEVERLENTHDRQRMSSNSQPGWA